jgi:AcrR family transcriptional regulator
MLMEENSQGRRGRKFDQVLEGARHVFMQHGFEVATMDDIAREAGVSKATLYSYFSDKRLLFMEVAKAECRRQAEEAKALIDPDASVEVVLAEAARRTVALIMSDLAQKVFRICVAECERFPELGQEFYRSGPMVVQAVFMDYLAIAVARGELVIDDLAFAADQFVALCKVTVHEQTLFGIRNDNPEAALDQVVKGAVAMFLAFYGRDRRA